MPKSTPEITGIVVPMASPLVDDRTLDVAGLERLVGHLIGGGADGVFVLGTTGEGPNLDDGVRIELIERTCALVNQRLPVLVGITATAWSESQRLASAADRSGASALVLAPPYYFPLSQDELLRYVEFACERLPLPMLLYNIPQMTKTAFEVATVGRLMEQENIWGIKDSSGNWEFFQALLEIGRRRADWSVLMGEESLLANAVVAGAHGGVPGGANLVPRLFAELYRAAQCGDRTSMDEWQACVLLLRRLYQVENSYAAVPRAVKTGLSLMGICSDYIAPPFCRYDEPQRQEIGGLLAELLAACDRLSKLPADRKATALSGPGLQNAAS